MYGFWSEVELRECVHVPKGLQQSKSELFHDMATANGERRQTLVLLSYSESESFKLRWYEDSETG